MITLEAIKTEQAKLAEKIAAFEKQASEPRTFTIPAACVMLMPDEHYAGIIVGKDGERSYHLMLLPGEAESVNWADAKAFAEETGGELPTPREQALLYANLKEHFKESAYWSGAQHAASPASAWSQHFDGGSQSYYHILSKLRARAVRRLKI
jgi:hypothetical protein